MSSTNRAWKTLERRVRDMAAEAFGFDFIRVANSGAGEMVKGDVMPKDLALVEVFPWTMEVKLATTKKISLENLLLSWKDPVWEWWSQAVVESEYNEKTLKGGMSKPMLVFKTSGSGTVPLAMVRTGDVSDTGNSVPLDLGIVISVCVRQRKRIKKGNGWRWGEKVVAETHETLLIGRLADVLELCTQ